MNEPKVSFAYNSSFSILGADREYQIPEYHKLTSRLNADGDRVGVYRAHISTGLNVLENLYKTGNGLNIVLFLKMEF